jgi:hypothetical protein
MNKVWDTLIAIQDLLEHEFNQTGTEIHEPGMDRFNQPGWLNRVWTSDTYRRAHIDVVDARETKGLWMMHCCVFPHTHNPGPIFGLDVVSGVNKITGFFHDYSPAGDVEHPMLATFGKMTSNLAWRKERELPEWAQRIFSKNMIAAGNLQDQAELNQIISLSRMTLLYYLGNIGKTNNTAENTTQEQNYYAYNQKQNPHTPKVMTSLGLNEDDVRVFIQDCLFPELV